MQVVAMWYENLVGILKLVSVIFHEIFIFSPNSPSKTMKNVFYFI